MKKTDLPALIADIFCVALLAAAAILKLSGMTFAAFMLLSVGIALFGVYGIVAACLGLPYLFNTVYRLPGRKRERARKRLLVISSALMVLIGVISAAYLIVTSR